MPLPVDDRPILEVFQGTELIKTVPVTGRCASDIITSYIGTEPVTTTVWPGSNQPVSFVATTIWTAVTPNPNMLRFTISSAQTASVPAGDYVLVVRINDGGEMVLAYDGILRVKAFAGGLV